MSLLTEKGGVVNEAASQENMRGLIIERAADLVDHHEALSKYESLKREILEAKSDEDAYRSALTAVMIQRTADFMEGMQNRYGESVVTQSLGQLPQRVLDVVRIFYPNQIAPDICDIQPIDGMVGSIFTMTPRYGTTFGGVNAGDDLFLNNTSLNNYASEELGVTIATGNGSTAAISGTISTSKPLRKGSVKVSTTLTTSGAITIEDDGAGNFKPTAGLTSGTIDYDSGAYSITFATAPTNTTPVVANYQLDTEVNEDAIRDIEIDISMKPVQCKQHPLTFKYSVAAGLAAQSHLSVDVDDTMANTAAQFIKIERDRKLVNLVLQNATPVSDLNFDADVTGLNYDKRAFYGELELKMDYAESYIQNANGRGGVDFMLCGRNVANVIRNARGFKPAAVVAPIGAHVIGYLRDGTVAVIKDITMDANTYVFGYKGYMAGDSATILAEWIPIYFTPTFQAPTLTNRQGVMSMYDMFVNRKEYYVKGTLSNYAA